MLIGVISDTHGDARAWEQAVTGPLAAAQVIIHAGDMLYHGPRNPFPGGYRPAELADLLSASPVPVLAVRGNCDAAIDLELVRIPVQDPLGFWEFAGLRLLAYHGHQQDIRAADLARQWRAHIVISGHTHVPHLAEEGGCYWLNPGSPSLPKGPAPGPTVARVTPEGIELVSLEGEVLQERKLEVRS